MDRARWRTTLTYRVLPTLQLGVEYNVAAEEVAPIGNWFVFTEDARRPALFVGTSSDRIGSPEGTQAFYMTAAKNLGRIPVAPYVTLNYSEWDEGFNVPFGVHADLVAGFSIRPMYDGHRTHLTASYSRNAFSVTALWVWLEDPGVALSFGF